MFYMTLLEMTLANWKEQTIFLAWAFMPPLLPGFWFLLLLLEGLSHGREGREEILCKTRTW